MVVVYVVIPRFEGQGQVVEMLRWGTAQVPKRWGTLDVSPGATWSKQLYYITTAKLAEREKSCKPYRTIPIH